MSHYQCSTCGIILGSNRRPVEEYPQNIMIYAVMYICQMCRDQGKTFNTPIKQKIPDYWKQNISEHDKDKEDKVHDDGDIEEKIDKYLSEVRRLNNISVNESSDTENLTVANNKI